MNGVSTQCSEDRLELDWAQVLCTPPEDIGKQWTWILEGKPESHAPVKRLHVWWDGLRNKKEPGEKDTRKEFRYSSLRVARSTLFHTCTG